MQIRDILSREARYYESNIFVAFQSLSSLALEEGAGERDSGNEVGLLPELQQPCVRAHNIAYTSHGYQQVIHLR